MKLRIALFFVALVVFQGSAYAQNQAVFPLDEMISIIKKEIEVAESQVIGEPRFTLSELTIDLSIAETSDKKGSLSVGVPFYDIKATGSASDSRHGTSKLTVKLAPPKPITLSAGPDLSSFPIAKYIVEARKQLQKGLKEPPYLDPQSLVLTIEFGVARKVEGQAGVKLVIVSVDGGASRSSASTNSIKLSFIRARTP